MNALSHFEEKTELYACLKLTKHKTCTRSSCLSNVLCDIYSPGQRIMLESSRRHTRDDGTYFSTNFNELYNVYEAFHYMHQHQQQQSSYRDISSCSMAACNWKHNAKISSCRFIKHAISQWHSTESNHSIRFTIFLHLKPYQQYNYQPI